MRDLTRNTNVGEFEIGKSHVASLAIVDDKTVVVGDQTGNVHFLDLMSGEVQTHKIGELWISNLTPVSSTGCLILDIDSQLICWDPHTRKNRWSIALSGQDAAAVVVLEELSRVLVATEYGKLISADLDTGVATRHVDTRFHPTTICLVNQNEDLVLAGEYGHIAIYEVSSLKQTGSRQGHSGPVVRLIAGHRNHQFISVGEDSTCRMWSLDTRSDLLELAEHSGPVTSIAFSPTDSLFASGGDDNMVRIWDLTANPPTKAVAQLPGHTHYIRHMVFANEGRVLFSADADGHLFAWDVTSGDLIDRFSGHASTLYGLDLSPDGKTLVSGDSDGNIRIWDLTHWKAGTSCEIKSIKTQPVWGLRFSKDGSQLISLHNINELRIWETTHWTLLKSVRISDSTYAISKELEPEKFVLGGKPQGTLEYVDLESGAVTLGHRLQNGQIYEFAVNADRTRLFSACEDQTIKVFSLSDNRQVISLRRAKPEMPGAIAFSDKFRLLGAGYMCGKVCISGDLRPLLNRKSEKDRPVRSY